jgi:lambda repressor-like predicted transcriptional regulator
MSRRGYRLRSEYGESNLSTSALKTQKQLLSSIGEDAAYILEPVAQLLAGMPQRKARKALRAAARRSLRLAAQDRGTSMRAAAREAGAVSRDLIQPVDQSGQIIRRLRSLRVVA